MLNPTRVVEVSNDADMNVNKMATLATGILSTIRGICCLKCSSPVVVLTADTPSPRFQGMIIINSEVIYEV